MKALMGKDYFLPISGMLYPLDFSVDYNVEVNGISATNISYFQCCHYKETQYKQLPANQGNRAYEFIDKNFYQNYVCK